MSELIAKIQRSFSTQAINFENKSMHFSKQAYLDYTVKSIELCPADHVLEVAAGTCAIGRAIAPFVSRVTCLDATPSMLEVGKKKAEKEGLTNIYFIEGFAENLPLSDSSFDVVVTRLSFHHFANMEDPLSLIHI